MDNKTETKKIFTCPDCSGKFKAFILSDPKVYKCPTCKKIVTVFPNEKVVIGDHTKRKVTAEEKESLDILDNITSKLQDEKNIEDEEIALEEKRLFSEIMYQMKEIKDKQEQVGKEISPDEFKRLRDENVLLKEKIAILQEDFKKLRGKEDEDEARAQIMKGLENEISHLKGRITSQAEIISNLTTEKQDLDAKMAELASNSDLQSGMKKIASTKEMLEQREVEINERELSLDKKEAELGSLRNKIKKDRETNEDFKKELDEYQSKLENRAISLSNEKEELERIKAEYAHVQDLAEELQIKEKELDERENNLHEMEKDLLISRGNLGQTEKMIEAISERERIHSIRENGLEDRESAITTSTQELSDLKKTLTEREKDIGSRDKDILEREKIISGREDDLKASSEKWKTFAKQLEEYKQQLAGSSKELEDRETKLVDREERLQAGLERLMALKEKMAQEVAEPPQLKETKEKEEAITKEIEDKKADLESTENKINDLLE